MKTIRIFISSPGDVSEERDKARRVIDALQRHYTGVKLQPVLWEDLALPATASFQRTIDFILQKEPIDIAVFILWSRLGSPLGSTITRTDGTPYRSGTEREFDVMLEAFEQSGKRRPVILAYTRVDENGFRQSLTNCPATGLEELISQRKLAESFIREQFKDSEGHNVRAYHSYREPVSFAQRLHSHLHQILDELLDQGVAPRWLHEPYRGLEVFNVEHAPIFQGRDEETCDVLQRLRDQEQSGCAFTVIVGASGSGKSSLARAGVAAALTQHAYDDHVRAWRVVTLFPSLGGGDLNRSLVRALAEQLPELRNSPIALDDIASGLTRDAALTVKLSIAPAFARASEAANGTVRILLLIDQLEELWTDRRITDSDRDQFLSVLEALARSGLVSVLATLRSDFYPHAQRIPAFLRLKGERGHCDLPPPGPAALHRLITEPARLAGLQFEPQVRTGRTLDQLILQDASRDPAGLPLLQYALSEMYQQRDESNHQLTFAAYEKLGGVEGALGKRASDTFLSLASEVQAALPEVLPQLVAIDIDGEQSAVRRRAPLTPLTDSPARKALIEALVAARFLTTDRQDDTPVVSLAHEALLRFWDELSQWVTKNREHLRLRARVEHSQQRWVQQNRDFSLLLSEGLALAEGQTLLRDARPLLSAENVEYIEQSRNHRHAQLLRNRLIRTVALAMSLMAAFITITAAAWISSERAAAFASIRLAEQQNAEACRRNENHFWRLAVHVRDADYPGNLRASHLFLRGAQSLGQISLSQRTPADIASLRSALQAAAAVDRICVHTQAYTDLQNGVVVSQDESRLLNWSDKEIQLLDNKSPEPIQIFKHDDYVRGAAFNANNSRVLTWSRDTTAQLWDVTKPKPIQIFKHDGDVLDAQFSRDESRVLTRSEDKTVRLWEVNSPVAIQVFRHDADVIEAKFSRDESRLLTRSGGLESNHAARLWDVTKPEPLQIFEHDDDVNGLRFNSDESRVLTWSDDDTVKCWDVTRSELIQIFKHGNDVNGAEFSRNESRVLTWSSDKTARLWDVNEPEPLQIFEHNGEVTGARFNRNESRVLTWSRDKTAQLWEVTDPTPIQIYRHDGEVTHADFSPDESHVLTCSKDETARLWQVAKHNRLLQQIPLKPLQMFPNALKAKFGPNGSQVHTWKGRAMRLWDITKAEPLQTFKHSKSNPVIGAEFNSDESKVLTWSSDHTASLWEIGSPEPLQTFEHKEIVFGAQFCRNKSNVLTWSFDRKAQLWEIGAPDPIQSFSHNTDGFEWRFGPQFSRDESRMLTWGSAGLSVWDLSKPKPTEIFNVKAWVTGARFNRDESRVLIWGRSWSGDVHAQFWDVSKRELLQTFKHDDIGRINGALFNHDESRVLTWSDDDTAQLWDVTKSLPIRIFQHKGDVSGARFCHDESRVLTWGRGRDAHLRERDGEAHLWEVAKADPILTLKHSLGMGGPRFSRDESRILVWSGRTAELWDLTKLMPLRAFTHEGEAQVFAPGGEIQAAEFSRDETCVLTWSRDKTARLWDLNKLEPIQTLRHEDEVLWAKFNRDGSRLLTCSTDGNARLWEIHNPLLHPDALILELEVRSGTTLDANLNLYCMSFEEWQAKANSPGYREIERKISERQKTQLVERPTGIHVDLPTE